MNTDRDDELSRKLAATLEHSLDTIDADALAHLAEARRHALAQRQKMRQVMGGLALAAGIAAIAVMPWLGRQQPAGVATTDASYLSVDPQLLADMDMLEVLGVDGMAVDSASDTKNADKGGV